MSRTWKLRKGKVLVVEDARTASLVVVAPSGKLTGPFDLGHTQGCPKPPKKSSKKRVRTSHR